MSRFLVEIDEIDGQQGLASRVLYGTVAVLRNGVQQLGLFEPVVEATVSGIRESLGDAVARRVRQEGFDRIHDFVDPADIPKMTDTVYAHFRALAPDFLESFVPRVFPGERPYYFEHSPNIRFHIPYDIAAPHREQYDKFAEKHGQGKIAAHGPHRDSWLDCPDNVVNLWIAVGPVQRGNGLSIFVDDRDTQFAFLPNGEIAAGQRTSPPLNFDLQPGDVLMFHSDALHASELNRTESTRVAVSFRVSFGKPHFPNGHYHNYDYSRLSRGPGRQFAGIPAKLQWSYFGFRLKWLKRKLLGANGLGAQSPAAHHGADLHSVVGSEKLSLTDFPIGSIRAATSGICVARLDENRCVALSRRCPHRGADLAEGFVRDGAIVCPWHNLHFDPETGASACRSLKPLRSYPCEIRGESVHVSESHEPTEPSGAAEA